MPRRKRSHTVWLPGRLVDLIEDQACEWAPLETGGMLVGYELADEDCTVVVDAIDAGPRAKRRPTGFEPDGSWQQAELERTYVASGRTTTYIGDWHSHPAGLARPSWRDHQTARSVSRHREARARHPLMVITTRFQDDWQTGAFRLAWLRLHRTRVVLY